IESRASYFNMHLYWKQEEKCLTSQRDKDTKNGKEKILAEMDLGARRQYKEVENSRKVGKQEKKRCEEQGRKTTVESKRINISQRRPIGKWKGRAREELEEGDIVSTS